MSFAMEQEDALITVDTQSAPEAGSRTYYRCHMVATLLIGCTVFLGVAGWAWSRKAGVVGVPVLAQTNQTSGLWMFTDDVRKNDSVYKNLDFVAGSNFGSLKFCKCALVGGGEGLKDKGHGSAIDSHDTVIRVNRVPTWEWYHDFGSRTTVLMVNEFHQSDGKVTKLGYNEGADWCSSLPSCQNAAILAGPGFMSGCPTGWLKDAWGDNHSMVGCTSQALKHMAWRFGNLQRGSPVSTGFYAFLTFATICSTLDVYGFSGSGAADGHVEWTNHPLEQEHDLERKISWHDWDHIYPEFNRGFSELPDYWDWFKSHVGSINFI